MAFQWVRRTGEAARSMGLDRLPGSGGGWEGTSNPRPTHAQSTRLYLEPACLPGLLVLSILELVFMVSPTGAGIRAGAKQKEEIMWTVKETGDACKGGSAEHIQSREDTRRGVGSRKILLTRSNAAVSWPRR